MGKRGKGKNRQGKGSYNPRSNTSLNILDKRIEKQQQPLRIVSSTVSHSLVPDFGSWDPPPHYGYIFMCNKNTKDDCFKFRVFGLPSAKLNVLYKIHPEMKLFLFDFDLRLLYGIFSPASRGEMSIEPSAFGGRFSAQVRFQTYKDCLPLHESVFKPIIRDNYEGSKFRQELTKEHVLNLMSLFCPVAMSPSRACISLRPPSASPGRIDEPPGFGVYSGTGFSTPSHQDITELHGVEAGPLYHSQHIEKPHVHVPHASVPKLQGISLRTVPEQPQHQQYYSSEARKGQDCFPALPDEELFKRYAAAPRDQQLPIINRTGIAQWHPDFPPRVSTPSHRHSHLPIRTLSAADWVAVANESLRNEMNCPSHQSIPSARTDRAVLSQTPPMEGKEAPIGFQHLNQVAAPSHQSTSSARTDRAVLSQTPPMEGKEAPIEFQHPNQVATPSHQSTPSARTDRAVPSQTPPMEEKEAPTGFLLPSQVAAPSHQNIPSARTNTAVLSQTPPMEEKEAPIGFQHPPSANYDSSSPAANSVVVPPRLENGPTYLPTPSFLDPGCWTAVVSQDANQVAAPQWQQVANGAINTQNAPTSVAQTSLTQGNYYVEETNANHYVPSTGATFDRYKHGTISVTNGVPVQAQCSTAYYSGNNGVSVQSHDPAAVYYSAPTQAGALAAYYSGTTGFHAQQQDPAAAYYYANAIISAQAHDSAAAYYSANTGIPGQPHDQAAAYYSANTSIPSQPHDQAAAYYSANTSIPSQPHDQAAAYYSANTGIQAPVHDQAAAYYSANTGIPAQAHDQAAAYYSANTGIPAQAHDKAAAHYPANTGIQGQAPNPGPYYPANSYGNPHTPSSSQAPTYWDPNQVIYLSQATIQPANNFTSVGGEQSIISLPGPPATIGPVNGL